MLGNTNGFSGRKSAESAFAQQIKQPAISCSAKLVPSQQWDSGNDLQTTMENSFKKLLSTNSLSYGNAVREK